MVWLPRWGCDGMITSAQKLLMARAGATPVDRSWDIAYASYSGTSFSIAGQETSPRSVQFKSDGTKMYVVGVVGDDVNEYALSSAWDVSSASYTHAFSLSSQGSLPDAIYFKPDGTKMYVVDFSDDEVNEYSLSTAWDVSSAAFVQAFSVSAQDSSPSGISFKDDGTKMFVSGNSGQDVNEYALSSAWDISSASYTQNYSVGQVPQDFYFKPDGTAFYIVSSDTDRVYQFSVSTPWDISTSSLVTSFSVTSQDTVPVGLSFNPDGSQMFIVGNTNDTVFAYDIG